MEYKLKTPITDTNGTIVLETLELEDDLRLKHLKGLRINETGLTIDQIQLLISRISGTAVAVIGELTMSDLEGIMAAHPFFRKKIQEKKKRKVTEV